jgi:hypothetical protein
MKPTRPSGAGGEARASTPLRTTGKQRGGITGKGFLPGRSGNAGGRPGGEALMRRCLRKSFEENEAQAMAALARRWGSTKHVQDMWELLAKLEGEMTKEAGEGARGISVIILQNNGASPLDPEVFREAARRKALEMCSSSPRSSSPRLDP